MVLINVIFLLVVAAIVTAVIAGALALLAMLLGGRRWYWIVTAAPVVTIVGVAVMYVVFTSPTYVFENEFGFPPPATVTIANSESFALGDSGSAFLVFTADAATVNRIIATGYVPEPAGTFNLPTTGNPTWYTPPTTSVSTFVGTNVPPRSFATESRKIVYDRNVGKVWYEFVGVD